MSATSTSAVDTAEYQSILSSLVHDERVASTMARRLSQAGISAHETQRSLGVIRSIECLRTGGPLSVLQCLNLLSSVSASLVPVQTWVEMARTLEADFAIAPWLRALNEAAGLLEAGMTVTQLRGYAPLLPSSIQVRLEAATMLHVNGVDPIYALAVRRVLLDHGFDDGPELVTWIVKCHKAGATADASLETGLLHAFMTLPGVPADMVVWLVVNRRPSVPVHRLTPKAMLTKVSTRHYLKVAAKATPEQLPSGLPAGADAESAWNQMWAAVTTEVADVASASNQSDRSDAASTEEARRIVPRGDAHDRALFTTDQVRTAVTAEGDLQRDFGDSRLSHESLERTHLECEAGGSSKPITISAPVRVTG